MNKTSSKPEGKLCRVGPLKLVIQNCLITLKQSVLAKHQNFGSKKLWRNNNT